MRSELYDALRTATEGEFELLGELDCDSGWIAYLAAAGDDGSLAILVLHRTPDGEEFDLQVVHALDGLLTVGKTTCPACAAAWDGWPRFCGACRRDLSGVAADAAVPGSSPAELLEAVRQASEGVYEVLGSMKHSEGGGSMYFAREDGGRVVGLVLEREADGELSLVRSWAYDHEALAAPDAAEGLAVEPVPAAAYVAAGAERDPDVPEAASVPPLLLLDPEPERPARARRRAPSRRVLYGAAGGLLVAAAVVLAIIGVQRQAPPAVAVAKSLDGTPPAAVPLPQVPAFTDSPAVTVPAPADTQPARPVRRPPRRPTPATPPVVVVEQPPTQPSGPTPEEDRQAVVAAAARYASAVESRQMDRVRAAYPGISGEETTRWIDWFSRFGPGDDLSVSHTVSQGPVIEGDRATMTFTLTMRYQGQRHRVTSRATLRREGSGWALQALNTPQ